jgi:cyclic pyranopterin phosphate synthase
MQKKKIFGQDFANTGELYLRVSVTGSCNYRCQYCTPEDAKTAEINQLSLARIGELIAFISATFPLYKIRFTGGEPLLRKGIVDMVGEISRQMPKTELALTTNGTALSKLAAPLRQAGLHRINLSLDDVDETGFATVTGGGDLQMVLQGLAEARKVGFEKIKINTVLLKSRAGKALVDMVKLAIDTDSRLRFIELMPFSDEENFYEKESLSKEAAIKSLRETFTIEGPAGNSGTASLYKFTDQAKRETEVGFISSVSEPFCNSCDRLRLDSWGRLHPCLRSDRVLSLDSILKEHGEKTAREQLIKFVGRKVKPDDWNKRSMVSLGG